MDLPFSSDEGSLLVRSLCKVTASLLAEGLAAPMLFLRRAVLMTSLLSGSCVASHCLAERGLVGALYPRLGAEMVVFLSNSDSVA